VGFKPTLGKLKTLDSPSRSSNPDHGFRSVLLEARNLIVADKTWAIVQGNGEEEPSFIRNWIYKLTLLGLQTYSSNGCSIMFLIE